MSTRNWGSNSGAKKKATKKRLLVLKRKEEGGRCLTYVTDNDDVNVLDRVGKGVK